MCGHDAHCDDAEIVEREERVSERESERAREKARERKEREGSEYCPAAEESELDDFN